MKACGVGSSAMINSVRQTLGMFRSYSIRVGWCPINRVTSTSQLKWGSVARKPEPHSFALVPVLKLRELGRSSFPRSYQCYTTRAFQSVPESTPVSATNLKTTPFSTNPSLNSNLKVSKKQDLPFIFTCKECGVRSTKAICSESHEKGVVVARCDGCNSFHVIADRLGLLGESSSVEEYLAARGVEVKKGSVETFNLALKDLAGVGSKLSDDALWKADSEVQNNIDNMKRRLFMEELDLIASENYTSRAVIEAFASSTTHNDSKEDHIRMHYIDELVKDCQDRALQAFSLKPKKWGVNVQPLSAPSANFEVYTAILSRHDRIMGLDLPNGSISRASIRFESMPYRLDESTGIVDYDTLEKTAAIFRPKLIVAGASPHPRDFDYGRMRKIADAVGAFLMMDMSHISGLVSAGVVADPFKFCDIVITATQKSLRGPRGSMIFFKKKTVLGVDLDAALNSAVLPGLQEGPHVPTIAGVAVCLNLVMTDEFLAYQHKMVSNSRALAGRLMELGYELVSGGTDNHLVLVDLRPLGIDGARVEIILNEIGINLREHSVPGDDDKTALVPGGVLISSSAMTVRGFKEDHFVQVADCIHEGVQIALEANKSATGSEISDFKKLVDSSDFYEKHASALGLRVDELIDKFPLPGLSAAIV